jgi:hypothetical protein
MVPVSLFLLSGCQKEGKHQVDCISKVHSEINSSKIKDWINKQAPEARVDEITYNRTSDPGFLNCQPTFEFDSIFCHQFNVTQPITQDGCTLRVSYDVQFCIIAGGNYLTNIFNVQLGTFPKVPPCSDITDYWLDLIDNGHYEQAQDSINHFMLAVNNQIESIIASSFLYNLNINCENNQLLIVDFYASSCIKSCRLTEGNTLSSVYCGIGCCQRTTSYCLRNGRPEKGMPYLSQSRPCETVSSACDNKISTECTTGSCASLFEQ